MKVLNLSLVNLKKRNKGRKSMDILKNLNSRLTISSVGIVPGGEEDIKEIIEESPIQLPEDYLNFLHIISGNEKNGISFLVDQDVDPDSTLTIFIWSASYSLDKLDELSEAIPEDEFFDNAWMIGDDLGDFVYYYAEGKEEFGLYRDEAGILCIEKAEKIADSLTDFLVKGIGIDVAITYPIRKRN